MNHKDLMTDVTCIRVGVCVWCVMWCGGMRVCDVWYMWCMWYVHTCGNVCAVCVYVGGGGSGNNKNPNPTPCAVGAQGPW